MTRLALRAAPLPDTVPPAIRWPGPAAPSALHAPTQEAIP
jgi:hypothetical protein